MSSLLEMLEDSLATNSDPYVRAELLGEKACYLARAGDIDAATAVVREMRSVWGDGRNVRAMVWVILAEGLISYFGQLGDESWDRVRRACAIARVGRLDRLLPLTLVWMAHLEFFRSDYVAMSALLNESKTAPGAESSDVRLRFALVMADATMYAGFYGVSQGWYERARLLAVNSSDRVAIGALIYNRSMLGLARILLERVLYPEKVDDSRLWRFETELKSAIAFDEVSNTGAFRSQMRANLARASLARGDFSSAREELNAIQGLTRVQSNRTICCVTAELALCAAGLGDLGSARTMLDKYLVDDYLSLDIDEQLLGLGAAYKVAEFLSDSGRKRDIKERMEEAVRRFDVEMNCLEDAIKSSLP